MSEEFDFEKMELAAVSLSAIIDQMTVAFRPTMKALATFEQVCLAAGMSPRAAALYAMRLAEGFSWPPMGGSA